MKVTCKQRGKLRKKRIRIRCTVKGTGASASAVLLRNGRAVAAGTVRRGRFAATVSRAARRRASYELVLTVGRGAETRVLVRPVALR